MENRWKLSVQFDHADLKLIPTNPETNALPLDQLAVTEHNQKYRSYASEYKAQVGLLKKLYYRCILWFEKYDTLKSYLHLSKTSNATHMLQGT